MTYAHFWLRESRDIFRTRHAYFAWESASTGIDGTHSYSTLHSTQCDSTVQKKPQRDRGCCDEVTTPRLPIVHNIRYPAHNARLITSTAYMYVYVYVRCRRCDALPIFMFHFASNAHWISVRKYHHQFAVVASWLGEVLYATGLRRASPRTATIIRRHSQCTRSCAESTSVHQHTLRSACGLICFVYMLAHSRCVTFWRCRSCDCDKLRYHRLPHPRLGARDCVTVKMFIMFGSC